MAALAGHLQKQCRLKKEMNAIDIIWVAGYTIIRALFKTLSNLFMNFSCKVL